MDDEDDVAGFFIDGYYVFDNFAPFQVEWREKLYPTAEHAYQAAHFIDTMPELAEKVRHCTSPLQASELANNNSKYDDPRWKEMRIMIMKEIINEKLKQHSYIRDILIKTDSKNIVEMNNRDAFWGWGPNRQGQNQLGKIWMSLRDSLR